MRKQLIPFRNISPEGWRNLAIAAAISFYVILSGYTIVKLDLCQNFGGDYCAYWSAGKIASEYGYAEIYDIDILTKMQMDVFGLQDNPYFQPYGIMYLPVFLVPFQLFALLKLPVSYLLWNTINLIIFIAYLWFFVKGISNKPIPGQFLILTIISLPLYINLTEGQVNVWLFVCIGEFIRANHDHRNLEAGLWLGGLLLKPQLLILIIPFLIVQRSKKTLLGFTISSFLVLVLSYALVGYEGFQKLVNILGLSAQGNLVSNPAAMINWRMLGWHTTSITTPSTGNIITIIGSVLTIGAAFISFRKRISQNENKFLIAAFGIFTATLAVSWHSHFHTLLILIPFILYLLINNNFSIRLYSAWVFVPILIHFLLYITTGLVYLGVAQPIVTQIVKFEEGIRGLVFNLILTGWTLREYSHINTKSETG